MKKYVTLVCHFVRLARCFVEQRLKHRNSDTRNTLRLSQPRRGTKDGPASSDSDSGVVCIHVFASRDESAKRERERERERQYIQRPDKMRKEKKNEEN